MSYVIYSYANNPRVFKAQIAGKFSGVEIELKTVELGKDNRTKDFLAKNPLGKVPTLDTPEGPIFESNAIARYVARLNGDPAKLYGTSVFESGKIDQWIDFSVNEIDLAASAWLYPIFGLIPENQAATRAAKGDIRKALGVLNAHLTEHQFLVGDRFSLADIVVAMSLAPLYKLVLDTGFRKQFTAANRWFTLVINQPKVKEVIGKFELAKKMATAPKVVASSAPAASSSSAAPAKAEKPAAAKKEAAKPAADAAPAKKSSKPKGPFDDCPKTNFNFKNWKLEYSNNDTREVAIPWFWKNYDQEGLSMWFCKYKYNEELSKLFMVSNLIAGFCQRVPTKLNSGSFGTFLIFGEEPNLEVEGVFLFRGQVIPELFKENPDFDVYEWSKVDVNDPEQKEYVEDLFAWNGKLRGKVYTSESGCVFKA